MTGQTMSEEESTALPSLSQSQTQNSFQSVDTATRTIGASCWDTCFTSCAGDAKGSVHRAWGVTIIFIILFAILAIVEVVNLQNGEASMALILAAAWTAFVQLFIMVIGTFILKRFSTAFAVGFFLGLLLLVAQQNLLLFVTFWHNSYGNFNTNTAFANFSLAAFAVYTMFLALLSRFRHDIMILPSEAKGLGRFGKSSSSSVNVNTSISSDV